MLFKAIRACPQCGALLRKITVQGAQSESDAPLALLSNIRLGWKWLTMKNTLAYYIAVEMF